MKHYTHSHAAAALAAAIALCGLVRAADPVWNDAPALAPARPIAPPDVQERVAAALNDLASETRGPDYPRAFFLIPKRSADPAQQSHRVVAGIPTSCGGGGETVFECERARRYAIRIFAAFGLDPARDVGVREPGVCALVDGVDAATGLGFELREYRALLDWRERNSMSFIETIEERGPEHGLRRESEVEYLDDAEAAQLRARGWQIHVDAPRDVLGTEDFTPSLAYVAGVISFLDDATDGPAVDLGGPLLQRQIYLYLPGCSAEHAGRSGPGPASELEVGAGALPLVWQLGDDPRCAVVERYRRPDRIEREAVVRADMPSTRGRIAAVRFAIEGGTSNVRWRLIQELPDVNWIRIETSAQTIFTPPSFDAARPFRIEADLGNGKYLVPPAVLIGLSED